MVNVELSKQLKKKYHHRIGHCYKNSYKLFANKEIDKLIIGYVRGHSDTMIRHSWGIKDGMVIDTTFRENELITHEYFPVFEFSTTGEYLMAMRKTSGPHMLELDFEKEKSILKQHGNPKYIRAL
jgi:hypothetical protein